MRLYLPRFPVGQPSENLERLAREVERAGAAGCNAALFPEQFLSGYSGSLPAAQARRSFTQLSAQFAEILLAFGTISEDGHNRQLLYLGGEEVARYDKVHLFRPNREDEIWQPGGNYAVLGAGGWRIGLLTCNDIRFPEQARALALEARVELLLCPAYWPWQRDHIWRALLQARAIENCCFIAGCCVASVDLGAEHTGGAGNYVFDPLGSPVLPQGSVYQLDRSALDNLLVDTREDAAADLRIERFGGWPQ